MKNKYLIIPNKIVEKKSPYVDFLFPLKGFCVGFTKEYSIEEIPSDSYIYVNRILDQEGIESLKTILQNIFVRGIVFEDLGVLEVILEGHLKFETIFYATHASCSIYTVNTYLKFVDSVVLSPDITEEECLFILKNALKSVCLYTYGPLPYMYSRRSLLTNYQKTFDIPKQPKVFLEETTTKKKFVMIENAYGTVCFDEKIYDGRSLLNNKNVCYHIINLDWEEIDDIWSWLKEFEDGTTIENTTKGFLNQKTIYRLPPRKESL